MLNLRRSYLTWSCLICVIACHSPSGMQWHKATRRLLLWCYYSIKICYRYHTPLAAVLWSLHTVHMMSRLVIRFST